MRVETLIKAGSGGSPTIEDVALINYKGTLPDGKVFDEGRRRCCRSQGVIPGFTKALMQMQRGGKYKVPIPSELGLWRQGSAGPIPANTDLTFEIELIDFRSRAEIEEQQRMMQQLQQMQQQQGGRADRRRECHRRAMPPGMPPGMPQGMPPGAAPPKQ